jgi:hypothetical protein
LIFWRARAPRHEVRCRSALRDRQRSRLTRLPNFLNSVIGHALLVGLPVALIAAGRQEGREYRS